MNIFAVVGLEAVGSSSSPMRALIKEDLPALYAPATTSTTPERDASKYLSRSALISGSSAKSSANPLKISSIFSNAASDEIIRPPPSQQQICCLTSIR